MGFIKDVWGGHDYIPRVWDSWFKQKDAKMFVVLVGGAPVGMNRIRFMEDGTAWLEGARVHPGFRGQGLATALGNNSMEVARERGIKLLRLTSGSRNLHAHHQIARMGFREASRFSIYSPSETLELDPEQGVRRLGPRDFERVHGSITSSQEFALGSGVMWDTFAAVELTPGVIRKALTQRRVYSVKTALAIAKEGGEGEVWNQVCFVTGTGEGVIRLAKHIFSGNGKRKADWRLVYLPQGSSLIGEMRRAGFEREFSHVLYSRETPKG
jgi:GNAT superfamily N-acetyltransferase